MKLQTCPQVLFYMIYNICEGKDVFPIIHRARRVSRFFFSSQASYVDATGAKASPPFMSTGQPDEAEVPWLCHLPIRR
jgi:hypothetical protein